MLFRFCCFPVFHAANVLSLIHIFKTDKKLSPTKLGEVVNGLMMDRFPNIISVEFTADMEKQLDQVEACLLYTSRCV